MPSITISVKTTAKRLFYAPHVAKRPSKRSALVLDKDVYPGSGNRFYLLLWAGGLFKRGLLFEYSVYGKLIVSQNKFQL